MRLVDYDSREALVAAVAETLALTLGSALEEARDLSFAVPGGTTPGPIFDILSARGDLDWSRVTILLSDERWVPETHELSNTALVKARLLTGPARAARFAPFYRDGLSAEDGCTAVAPTLAAHLPLSVLMLGMGADMHTASLFPAAPGTAEAMAPGAPALCPVYPADHDVARVTLSAPVLQAAARTHIVIFGADKRAAVNRAQALSPQEAPVAAVLGGATVHCAS
ncbi:MAG: 6-phosphogluconolactonase [Pseudomonadota bacterium]